MSILIASTSPAFGKSPAMTEALRQRGWELQTLLDPSLTGPELLQDTLRRMNEAAADMDYLSVGLAPVSAQFIARAPQLKGLVKFGVGVDNIDIPAASARRIPVVNAPRANSNAVAELALGYMLELARRMWTMHATILAGGWTRHVGWEIEGKTLGIVGLGSVGKILAAKARALGLRVLATDPYPDMAFCTEHGIPLLPLEQLLSSADFVSLHVAGGERNRNLMGMPQFQIMKRGACLLNLSRGEIVDTGALTTALREGHLGGAALDAFIFEPPDRNDPLFALPNVLFTPHVGGHTVEAQQNVNRMNLEDLDLLEAGQRPRRVVNPEIYS